MRESFAVVEVSFTHFVRVFTAQVIFPFLISSLSTFLAKYYEMSCDRGCSG